MGKLEEELAAVDGEIKALEAKFIEKVYAEYLVLIREIARKFLITINDRSYEEDDLVQELMMYLSKWSLKVVVERSNGDEIYVPYIKRSAKNCFINLEKRLNCGKRANLLKVQDTNTGKVTTQKADFADITDFEDSHFFDMSNPEDSLMFDEVKRLIWKNLSSKRDRAIFRLLVDTPEKFDKWLGSRKLTKQVLADYLGCTYSAVIISFKRIQSITKNCLAVEQYC